MAAPLFGLLPGSERRRLTEASVRIAQQLEATEAEVLLAENARDRPRQNRARVKRAQLWEEQRDTALALKRLDAPRAPHRGSSPGTVAP